MTDNTDNNSNNGSQEALLKAMLEELKVLRQEATKPTTMKEMNPGFIVLVNGKRKKIRDMNTIGAEEINIPGFGKGTLLELAPRPNDGPTGFQRTYIPTITLYMSLDKFLESVNGNFTVDLTQYCKPPKPAAYQGMPEFGTEISHGLKFVGISPETGKAMLIEPVNEPFRVSFGKAKKIAKRRSKKTGDDCRVPSPRDWEEIIRNREIAHTSGIPGSSLGLFNRLSQIRDGWYWTSNSESIFKATVAAPQSHISHRYLRAAKPYRNKVRLVHYVPADSLRKP